MLDLLIGPVTGLLDKFIPDAEEKARLAHEIATLAEKQAHEIALAQIKVNEAEANYEIIKGSNGIGIYLKDNHDRLLKEDPTYGLFIEAVINRKAIEIAKMLLSERTGV